MAVTYSFQLQIAHRLKHWILDFPSFEMVYSMYKMDFGKCSKSAQEDYRFCPLFSSLCFSSLLCSFLAYFERLWQRAMEIQILVSSWIWAFKSFSMKNIQLSLILGLLWWAKSYQKAPKLTTKWLKPITKDLNELIGLNEYDYYSKVLKTIMIRSTK